MFRLANRNFEEMVMGYEMKHASIVQADGTLNLSKLERLIKAAQENNMQLFGHTLTWHSGQNAAYLNSLIAPVLLPLVRHQYQEVSMSHHFRVMH